MTENQMKSILESVVMLELALNKLTAYDSFLKDPIAVGVELNRDSKDLMKSLAVEIKQPLEMLDQVKKDLLGFVAQEIKRN